MNSALALKKKKICLSGCRYDVVCRVALECGFKIVPEHELWNLNWSDAPLPPEKVMEMRRVQNANAMSGGGLQPLMQKMNHFPGMYEICRKDRLGRNLNKLKRVFSEEYDFFPSTWDLPSDMSDLMSYWRRNKNSTFIIKPESGCQGKGIFLVRNLKVLCPFAKCVCQLYISQPFLIDGYKYDQRIYVLITCVDPLRIYICNEGIARFATVKYSMPNDQNLDVVFMHLTNYSLNKFSESYDPEGEGSKRKLSTVYSWMTDNGYNVKKLIDSIDDIVIKTIICAAPTLRHNYRTSFPKREYGCSCFELLGFDILVDRHLRPMLVEVNHSPSFNLDLPVDNDVKTGLLRDVLAMVCMDESDKKGGSSLTVRPQQKLRLQKRLPSPALSNVPKAVLDQFSHEEKHQGNFRLIFTEQNPGKYARFLDKEYSISSMEEDSFLKKRLEPRISDISRDDYWAGEARMKTLLKQTKNGQIYVETRPKTPGVLDPQEFMKFKCSVENSSIYNKFSEPEPLKSTKAFSSKKKKLTIGESSTMTRGQEIEKNSNSIAECSQTNQEIGSNSHPVLSPSQRVKIALEKLRQKNVEKFKFTAKINDGVLRSAIASIGTEKTSPYLVDALRLTQQKSKKKLKKEIDLNNNPVLTRPGKVTDLDTSKLPSVCSPFLKIQPFGTEKAQGENQRKSSESNDFIENWISKGCYKPVKYKSNNSDVNNYGNSNDNEINRLQLATKQSLPTVLDKTNKMLSKALKLVSKTDRMNVDEEERPQNALSHL